MRTVKGKAVLLLLLGALALAVASLAWAIEPGLSEARQGSMHNCPQAGKWATAVWRGDDGTDASQAIASCGEDAVAAAYSLDPETGGWLRWFSGRPEISTLSTLDDAQGILALGGAEARPTPSPTPTPTLHPWAIAFVNDADQAASGLHVELKGTALGMPLVENVLGCSTPSITYRPEESEPLYDEVDLEWSGSCVDHGESVWLEFTNLAVPGGRRPVEADCFSWTLLGAPLSPCTAPAATPSPTPAPTPSAASLENCPQPGKWAISVWNGEDSAYLEQASATCSDAALAAAYYLDPASQSWLRWFAGRPEITTLSNLGNLQGVIALGIPRVALGDQRIAFASDRDGNVEIYGMNADGTGHTNLTDNPAEDGDLIYTPVSHHAWSPDGSRIAFVSYRDGNGEIYVMNADGSGQTNLTNNPWDDQDPTWSPDGSKIAFDSRLDDKMDIYLMNADGTGQTNLTNSPGLDLDPHWSPDGSKIAFVSDRDGNNEIYVMNADGTGQTNLTNNPGSYPFAGGNDYSPGWSPDMSKIAFVSDRDVNTQIYVTNVDGTGQINVSKNAASDGSPRFSPDGSKMVFECGGDANADVCVMNADGSGRTNLTNNPSSGQGTAWEDDPVWSPDGSRIAFVSDRDGHLQIYVMNADGSGQTNLSKSAANDTSPVWSP
jgi:Tol biopolymer transport system component